MKNHYLPSFIFLAILFNTLSGHAFEEAKTFSELGVDEIFMQSPVDDPIAYQVEEGNYEVKVSPYFWVVPGPGSASEEVVSQRSNNNVAIEFFENRLFIAFRTGPTHFASKNTRMYVISTADGKNWDMEWKSGQGHDAREPQLVAYNGYLHFYYFNGGTSPVKFEPSVIHEVTRLSFQKWSKPQKVLEDGEVHWEMKVRKGLIWMTSYHGEHYKVGGGAAQVKLKLKHSDDGRNFISENLDHESVYTGGASETGFEFDEEGNLWGVTRNEDGDESGFGAHLVFAPNNFLSQWSLEATAASYQSPRMFRHGRDIYLVARRQLGAGAFDWVRRGGFALRRIMNWAHYSFTPKTTSLFKINLDTRQPELLMDLPGAGDTAFPSIRRVNNHTFLIANYTSVSGKKKRIWIVGQLAQTKIYLIALKFVLKQSDNNVGDVVLDEKEHH